MTIMNRIGLGLMINGCWIATMSFMNFLANKLNEMISYKPGIDGLGIIMAACGFVMLILSWNDDD